MPVIENTVMNRLKIVIAQDYTAGFSGYDLSASGSVITGAVDLAGVIPSASIVYVDTIEAQGRSLGRYQGTMRFQIIAFAGGSSISDRISNSLDLAGDISKSITEDRSLQLAGTIEDVLISRTSLDGQEMGIPAVGISMMELKVTFSNQFGV
jgi:hypothetical protein